MAIAWFLARRGGGFRACARERDNNGHLLIDPSLRPSAPLDLMARNDVSDDDSDNMSVQMTSKVRDG